MWKLYVALIVAAIVAAACLWFKETLDENATLQAAKKQLTVEVQKKDNVIDFERGRAKSAEAHSAALEQTVNGLRRDRDQWKGNYDTALHSDKAATDWGEAFVPPSVTQLMGVRDRQRADRLSVHPDQVAGKAVPRLPLSGPASKGADENKGAAGRGG